MKCNSCNHDLHVVSNEQKSAKDSTDVYSVQTLICVNQRCPMYCGADKSKTAKTIETKVN